jgi:hypothetical protein
MLKAGLALLLAAGVAYAVLPELRGWTLASSPIFLFLLCSLYLLLTTTMTNGESGQVAEIPSRQKQAKTFLS